MHGFDVVACSAAVRLKYWWKKSESDAYMHALLLFSLSNQIRGCARVACVSIRAKEAGRRGRVRSKRAFSTLVLCPNQDAKLFTIVMNIYYLKVLLLAVPLGRSLSRCSLAESDDGRLVGNMNGHITVWPPIYFAEN